MSVARLLPALVLLAGCGGSATAPTVPERHPSPPAPRRAPPARAAVVIPAGAGHLAAMAGVHGLTVRSHPNGKVLAHLKPTTAWGSPTIVWAAERRGPWLGVVAAALSNNRIGWIDTRHDRPRMWRSRYTLLADLSVRTLELRRGSKLVRRIPVSIGGASTPTPTGRFAVTDKLIPSKDVSYYGCCVIALSGHQTKLRPGWAGGDRIAIHGSAAQLTGTAGSGGCLRARDSDLRMLMRRVPLGTPVLIRA
jgi:L,D-transpeptidase-like protein